MFLSPLTFRPDLFLKAKLCSFLWLAFLWLGQYLRNLCSVWKHLCLWGINNAGWHCFPYLRTQDFLTAGDRTFLWAGWGSSRLNTLSAHRESGPWIDLEDNDAYILSGATGCGSRVTWYHWLMCRRTVSPGLGGLYLESHRLWFSCLSCSLCRPSPNKGTAQQQLGPCLLTTDTRVPPLSSHSQFPEECPSTATVLTQFRISLVGPEDAAEPCGSKAEQKVRSGATVRLPSSKTETGIAFSASFPIKFR